MNQTFMVYHATPEHFRNAMLAAYDGITPTTLDLCFVAVARVRAEAVGHTFQLTNHGVPGQADNWTRNPEVVDLFTPAERTRSTSVGDVVKDESTGECYVCLPTGWSAPFIPFSTAPLGQRGQERQS
jgi:hypothetical protein